MEDDYLISKGAFWQNGGQFRDARIQAGKITGNVPTDGDCFVGIYLGGALKLLKGDRLVAILLMKVVRRVLRPKFAEPR